jgi:hypothetical protein
MALATAFPARTRPVPPSPFRRPVPLRNATGPARGGPVPAGRTRPASGGGTVVRPDPAGAPPAPPLLPAPTGPVYGFDIETDTTVDGLDPRCARILAAAVAGPEGTEVFDDADEAVLLDRLDWFLAGREPGVLATWNGGGFDLPFVADRAARHGLLLGLRLALVTDGARTHAPLPGHEGIYRGSWHGHAHIDGYRVFRGDVGPALGVSSSLKSVARLCGLQPIEVDRAAMHECPPARLRAYVASDAVCARLLVSRRWSTARLAVDRPPAPGRAAVMPVRATT